MKFAAVLKTAAAVLATGALLVPSVATAQAEPSAPPSYPPHVSVLYAAPFVAGGYTTVTVRGENLAAGMTVTASRGSKAVSAPVSVYSDGTLGTAMIKVSSVLSTIAGRYTVTFRLTGTGLTGTVTTTQTYTVGKAINIRGLKVTRKSYGLYISGMAAKYAPVKVTVKFGSRTYGKTVTSSRTGYFFYRLFKTTKGTYLVTAKVAPNKKYFSDAVSATYTRR